MVHRKNEKPLVLATINHDPDSLRVVATNRGDIIALETISQER